jgi:hypothetical protein
MKSINRRFIRMNDENDAYKQGVEAGMKSNSEKLLKHQKFVPTLSGAWGYRTKCIWPPAGSLIFYMKLIV